MTLLEVADQYRGVRVVVLGATGFLGRSVAASLARAGAELHAGVRAGAPGREPHGAVIHPLDLADLARTTELIDRLRPAVVFNLAGFGVDPDEKRTPDHALARRLNTELPIALASSVGSDSAGWPGRALVHVGSIAEYGPIAGRLTEDAPPRPTGLYPETKLAGTAGVAGIAHQRRIPAVTARLAQVYGPGEHPGRLLPLLIAARSTGSLETLSVGTQRKDFTFSEDVVEGLLRLGLSSGPPGEWINLATGVATTVADFVTQAAHLLRLPTAMLRFERPIPPGELTHESLSVDRLRAATGWVPTTTIREGILRTVAALQKMPNE